MSRALVLGGRTGLVGRPLTEALAGSGFETHPVGRADFDPLDPGLARATVARLRPEVIVNTVAYTQVDRAEDEPEAALRLNVELPALWARLAAEHGARLVHLSTDFVFDGPRSTPWRTTDTPSPASVYGTTKLAGEREVLAFGQHLVIRTAWLFGPGKMNFVARILELAREREFLRVVKDQIGSPTCTLDLARMTQALIQAGEVGLYHLVNSGQASWFTLAREAVRLAGLACEVRPIASHEYPQKAKRPAYSVLDTTDFTRATGLTPSHWSEPLAEYVAWLGSS